MIAKNKFGIRTLLLLCAVSSLALCCSSNDEAAPVDCNTSTLALEVSSSNPTGCASANGAISIASQGGQAPYQFALNTGALGTTSVFSNLTAGTYTVKVKDNNGCEKTQSVTLQASESTLAFSTTSTESGCKTSDGTISVTATGGTTPYEYKVNNNSFTSSSVLSSLTSGNYSVTVKDAEGCTTTQEVSIKTGVSFADDLKPLLDTKCTPCHASGGTAPIAFTSYTNIKSRASLIKSKTQDNSMPKGGPPLSQAEKDLIACWVDDGAVNN